jgi:hypothetical protein
VHFRGDRVVRGSLEDPAFRARILESAGGTEVYVGAPLTNVAAAALPGKITTRVPRPAGGEPTWGAAGDLVVLRVRAE